MPAKSDAAVGLEEAAFEEVATTTGRPSMAMPTTSGTERPARTADAAVALQPTPVLPARIDAIGVPESPRRTAPVHAVSEIGDQPTARIAERSRNADPPPQIIRETVVREVHTRTEPATPTFAPAPPQPAARVEQPTGLSVVGRLAERSVAVESAPERPGQAPRFERAESPAEGRPSRRIEPATTRVVEAVRERRPVADPAPQQPAPTINVTIGLIEIKAAINTPQRPARTAPQSPVMSLDEYLRQRSGEKR